MKKLYFLLCVSIFFAFGNANAQALQYKDVAPVFYNRCTSCHHPGGAGPFSLLSYSETVNYSAAVKAAVESGIMPPWSPDTTYQRYLHERIITESEKNALISWIDSGSVMGDTSLAPAPPVYTGGYKLSGTPDLVLQIPTFTSNANSADAYNCFSIPTGLTEDRIIRAYELVPGNPAIVHHVVIKVDTSGTTSDDLSGTCVNQPGDFDLEVWAPGAAPTVYPGEGQLKMGVRLKAGSKLVLQIHYPPGTSGQMDSTSIRLFFYPDTATGIRQVYSNTWLQNWQMYMSPNSVSSYDAEYAVSSDISLYSTFPHSHMVCTKMDVYAYNNSSSDTIPLIRINDWDFHWQGFYFFRNLLKIPAGYTLRSEHLYDNTANNPHNPNSPPKLVVSGFGTGDEMLFDSFQWLYYQPGDENISLDSLLANDTLLMAAPEIVAPTDKIHSYVFPNPFDNSATLIVLNEDVSKCELKIYDSRGKEVSTEVIRNADSFTVKSNNLPPGVYFYTINSDHYSGSGKIIRLANQ